LIFFRPYENQSNVSQGAHTKHIIPELLRRFKSAKNTRIAEF